MAAEDMDRAVSSNPFVYDQIRSLGVSAGVWDDVLDELLDEPFGNIRGPFGFLLADLNGKIGPQSWTTHGETAFPITISCAVS